MKKLAVAMLTLILCVSALAAVPAFAHHTNGGHHSQSAVCAAYVDIDCNGICDDCGEHHADTVAECSRYAVKADRHISYKHVCGNHHCH